MSEEKSDVMDQDIDPWPEREEKGEGREPFLVQDVPKQSGWTTFFNTLGVLFAIIGTVALFLGITWENSQGLFDALFESKTPRGPEKETIFDEINWSLIHFGFWAVAWSITMYLFSHLLQVLWDMRNYLRGMYEREPATTESADSAADVLWDMRNYLRGMYEREPATTESADSAADVPPCAEQ